ncbi:MAG: 4-hydroxyphenylpyruvate dioxygenase [Polyangiaceae bacterium]|nr:4-hydroxyphenylpyruvate dioxygenase [Polyangiaceae bacterium]
MTTHPNPALLDGIDFVEFVSPDPARLHELFTAFGFSRSMRHERLAIDLYRQGDITLLVNRAPDTFAARFGALHGPSISSMGWRTRGATEALSAVRARGAVAATASDLSRDGQPLPAIVGIGDSLIYLVDGYDAPFEQRYRRLGFVPLDRPDVAPSRGFSVIDHLTNNVHKGTMQRWASFYKEVFGFTEVRYFDIRGVKTGLTSYALRSPCGRFCIPINEADEKKSQINEYLDEYNGPGIQHLAFATDDLLASLDALRGSPIGFLDIDDDYYDEVFTRVPHVTEDHARIRAHQVLVDGDADGYLLQIFTKNLVGPIFIELIQRKNHLSFGEGNFGALFRSIERDQAKRGVFDA